MCVDVSCVIQLNPEPSRRFLLLRLGFSSDQADIMLLYIPHYLWTQIQGLPLSLSLCCGKRGLKNIKSVENGLGFDESFGSIDRSGNWWL